MTKTDRLYIWLNDMRFGIAPDESVTDINERRERQAQVDVIDDIMEWLEKNEQEPKWIPCSERLPENNMPYLVSVGEFFLTQIAMYSDLMGTIGHKIFYMGDYGKENFEDITKYVKAWMPLPEPYKEG